MQTSNIGQRENGQWGFYDEVDLWHGDFTTFGEALYAYGRYVERLETQTAFNQVQEFIRATGERVPFTPEPLGSPMIALRMRLLREEHQELLDALMDLKWEVEGLEVGDEPIAKEVVAEHLAAIGKEIADVVYVALGAAAAMGLPFDRIFDAVHAANMTKVGGERDHNGKLMKPKGYKEADVLRIVRDEMGPMTRDVHTTLGLCPDD